jgi:succinate dehydrogenase/fumarate reductase flavoprotein subunit
MLGAFTNGAFAGEDAIRFAKDVDFADYDQGDVVAEQERVLAPTKRDDGIPPNQIEYKTRRLVNDYLQPPKVTRKMELAQRRLAEVRFDAETAMYVRDSHELMRGLEAQSILDCADMAAAASLYRTESRWGLYHSRVEYPDRDDANWFCHSIMTKGADGKPTLIKKPVAPYVVEIEEHERDAYYRQRIRAPSAAE